MLRTALLLAALCFVSCKSANRGRINGIEFEMSVDRPAVEDGVAFSLRIEMESVSRGFLWVDDIPFGWVETGDRVLVTDDAVVLVNGEPRETEPAPSELRRALEPPRATRLVDD